MARRSKPPKPDAPEAREAAVGADPYEAATAAWLTALSGLPEVDEEVARRARQSMATALSGTAAPSDLFEQQWSIVQATIEAMQTDGGTKEADAQSALAGARSIFAAASEAIHAVNVAAATADHDKMDRILEAFRTNLSAMHRRRV